MCFSLYVVHVATIKIKGKKYIVGNRRACMNITLITSFLLSAFKNYVIFQNFSSSGTQKFILCYYMTMKSVPALNILRHDNK